MSTSQALQRQEYILRLLARDGRIDVEEVARRLRVSVWTVRRDLNKLEERGALQRMYGGAEAASGERAGAAWAEETPQHLGTPNLEAKRRIGLGVTGLADALHVRGEVGDLGQPRDVEVGQRTPLEAEIKSDLEEGTEVVTHPSNQISDGSRVERNQ